MKDKIFGVLQRVGRSFMLPIAILPVAGLLLGVGSSFTNATMIETYGLQAILGDGTVLHALLTIMSKAGSVIFDNLPLIFAVGVAIGMAKKEKEVAALAAMISCTGGKFRIRRTHSDIKSTPGRCTGRRDDSGTCAERNRDRCMRYPDTADGSFRRYYCRSGRCSAPQQIL